MRYSCKIGIFSALLFSFAFGQSREDQLAAVRTLLRSGSNDAAITKLNEIAARQPTLPGLNHEFGVAYYGKSDYLKAIGYLSRALEENKDDRDALQLLGLAYYLSGQPARAVPYLEQLESAPGGGSSDAMYVLGLCYALTKEYQHALSVISKLYNLPLESASSRLIFSRILLLQGLDPIAEQQVREVLKQAANMAGAHFILGQIYLYRSDLARAIAEFQAELEINPTYALALTRLGEAYSEASRFDEAQSALQRSIWMDASNSESYVWLGKVLMRKREFRLAPRLLEQAIALAPNDYTAHHLLAEAYHQLGQADLAAREMQIGARLEQQQPNLKRR